MNKKRWLIILICFIFVVVAALVGWQLRTENKTTNPLDMKDEDFETEMIPWDDEKSDEESSNIPKAEEGETSKKDDTSSLEKQEVKPDTDKNDESGEQNTEEKEDEIEQDGEVTLPFVPFQ